MKKIKKNEDYFNQIDTELKAYLLGYFLADGCITNPSSGSKCVSMCLQESDKYVLEWFIKETAPEIKISKYTKPSTGHTQYSFKYTAKQMAINLENIWGIKPRKTADIEYKFPFEKIPSNLIHHFIRGFFDGDGWITLRQKTPHGLTPPQFGFISTSLNFILQLKEIIPAITIPRICINQGVSLIHYQLIYSLGKGRVPIIKSWLYNNAHYFLKRKKDKFDLECDNVELTEEITKGSSVV